MIKDTFKVDIVPDVDNSLAYIVNKLFKTI